MDETLFDSLRTSERILNLLKSDEKYGGPQSAKDVYINLKMKPKNATSMLSRLCKKGEIERLEKGIYKISGDDRKYDKSKPHYKK